MKQAPKTRAGFSLIEVNMAILIIAVGMLSLMSLFPLGLRESTLAQGDMHQAAGADYILSRIQAEARRITLFSEWSNEAQTVSRLAGEFDTHVGDAYSILHNFPGQGDQTRYRLRIVQDEPFRYLVAVQLSERTRGDFGNNTWFYTEVIYHGSL